MFSRLSVVVDCRRVGHLFPASCLLSAAHHTAHCAAKAFSKIADDCSAFSGNINEYAIKSFVRVVCVRVQCDCSFASFFGMLSIYQFYL